MKKNNVRVTRTEQDRKLAAAKRRAKRSAARYAIVAPYIRQLALSAEKIAQLNKELSSRQPVSAANEEVPNA